MYPSSLTRRVAGLAFLTVTLLSACGGDDSTGPGTGGGNLGEGTGDPIPEELIGKR